MVYLLGEDGRRDERLERVLRRTAEVDGVELAIWSQNGEACVRGGDGELRFAPGSSLRDDRGRTWEVEGSFAVLDAQAGAGEITTPAYPDALGRIWSALAAGGTGDVLLSAAPGYEFTDWGGADHTGGGSHGSLGSEDSLVPLVCWGCGPDLDRGDAQTEARQWSITDVARVVLDHFGLQTEPPGEGA
jgi:hypothetical protein